MASPDNLPTFEPWMFRSTIGDSWIPDAFARETETALTKALHQSLINNHHHHESDVVPAVSQSFMVNPSEYCSAAASTVTVSGSGSEPETPGSKRRGSNLGVKTTKRKSRASKRSMTTFIQADPANFRQMVQQVTGVKLEGMMNGQLPVSTVVKPEPHRQPFVNRLQGLLPTLDTSAYLLDHPNNNNRPVTSMGFAQPQATNTVSNGGGAAIDFDSFCSFPTLESWN